MRLVALDYHSSMHESRVIAMHKAKSTLSQLVKRAAAGGEIVLIGPNGRAMAKLTSVGATAAPKRRLGLLKGKLVVPEDFDTPLPTEVISDFEGGVTQQGSAERDGH